MENLQGPINFLFFLFIYVPINIVLMLLVAVIFNVINKVLRLNFPNWALAVSAGLLVFLCMFAMLDSIANKGSWVSLSNEASGFYLGTLVINVVVIVLMLTMSGIKSLVFRNATVPSFTFAQPQIIATSIYGIIAIFLAITPLIRERKEYLSDVANTAMLKALKQTIETNDVKELEAAREKNSSLWNVKLAGEQRSLFDYIIRNDKPDLAHVLLKDNKAMFQYTFDWDVQSSKMMDALIADGMEPEKAVEIATNNNKPDLAKATVGKYHPKFDTLVSFITYNVIKNNDTALLDYLLKNGLAKNNAQASKTLCDVARLNNFEALKLLVSKGFVIDTAYSNLIYSAIYNGNLPMLKFMFQYPFNVDVFNDEYTNVENAIIGDKEEIFDYLLTKNPDIKSLHITQLNGETNALLIAKKYKQSSMLAKLKRM